MWTVGSANNATALTTDYIQTEVIFPSSATVAPQSWAVTWEGNLMGSPRFSGQMQGGGTSLVDLGQDFCRVGAQARDIVTLVGCTADNQCGIGKTCVLGSNGALGAGGLPITGLCLTPTLDRTRCDDLLSTVKRYDVTTVHQNELVLEPHKDELVRPALKPCAVTVKAAADGGTDAGRADGSSDATSAGGDAGANTLASQVLTSDCVDPNDPSTSGFQCIEGRCIYPCDTDKSTVGCRAGRICLPTDTKRAVPRVHKKDSSGVPIDELCDGVECYCNDGPNLPEQQIATCLGELLPYQVGAGRSFVVSGSQTGVPVTEVAGPNGVCGPMPNLDERVQTRISMDAPDLRQRDATTTTTAAATRTSPTRSARARPRRPKRRRSPSSCCTRSSRRTTDRIRASSWADRTRPTRTTPGRSTCTLFTGTATSSSW